METAKLITRLSMWFDLDLENVHAIGHSLGAQACGALGKELQNPKIGRISGKLSISAAFSENNSYTEYYD